MQALKMLHARLRMKWLQPKNLLHFPSPNADFLLTTLIRHFQNQPYNFRLSNYIITTIETSGNLRKRSCKKFWKNIQEWFGNLVVHFSAKYSNMIQVF